MHCALERAKTEAVNRRTGESEQRQKSNLCCCADSPIHRLADSDFMGGNREDEEVGPF